MAFPTDTHRWVEASLTAQGDARIQTELTRETHTPDGGPLGRVVSTRVVRTIGEVQIGSAEPLRFDSAAPKGSDPWVLQWQHRVGSVPALVRLDGEGRPTALDDPAAWRTAVLDAVESVAVPPGTSPPLDPDVFVADLSRTFPGRPPEGSWSRAEPVAGVQALREEVCARAGTRDGAPLWRCDGTCRATDEAGPQLFETDCWTEVWLDRDGLRGLETGYAGTRVWMEGGFVNDVAIAGQRLVLRRDAP